MKFAKDYYSAIGINHTQVESTSCKEGVQQLRKQMLKKGPRTTCHLQYSDQRNPPLIHFEVAESDAMKGKISQFLLE